MMDDGTVRAVTSPRPSPAWATSKIAAASLRTHSDCTGRHSPFTNPSRSALAKWEDDLAWHCRKWRRRSRSWAWSTRSAASSTWPWRAFRTRSTYCVRTSTRREAGWLLPASCRALGAYFPRWASWTRPCRTTTRRTIWQRGRSAPRTIPRWRRYCITSGAYTNARGIWRRPCVVIRIPPRYIRRRWAGTIPRWPRRWCASGVCTTSRRISTGP
mmetsp:Transcript_19410/g.40667  ORF Transcript_19410/g.40667 Transcript_19410/m.40667 type:complete len:214 (-) Transcript_19410:540-1181(-)